MIANLYSEYRRAARAGAHRLARPVISIGNISMGGRGKTPLAALVAQLFVEAGERPSILSRGYGREIADDGVTVVSDGHRLPDGRPDASRLADLAHSGDEPLMLARAVPGAAVLVCDERALAGTLGERALGCTVHVLDDGFQHHQLHRDVDIVLVAQEDLKGQPLPFGRLREPVSVLQDADTLVFDGNKVGSYLAINSRLYFSLTRQLGIPKTANSGTLEPWNPGTPVFAIAGIAKPERFVDSLTSTGYTLAGTLGFGDHHRYTAADVARIGEAAKAAGAMAIVTTSKDMVRLEAFSDWPVPLIEIPLEVSVEPAAEFRVWLLGRLAEARR